MICYIFHYKTQESTEHRETGLNLGKCVVLYGFLFNLMKMLNLILSPCMWCFAVLFFSQALHSCPGQLRDVQCGPAPPSALQG